MNPFKTLGIAPEIVRDLKDEQLLKHVKAVYRSLLLLFHPDIGGTDKATNKGRKNSANGGRVNKERQKISNS